MFCLNIFKPNFVLPHGKPILFLLPSLYSNLSSTHPSSQEGQWGDDPLLGDALQDPGRSVKAAHARRQGGDVKAQQKEETHQGDLEEDGKQTEGEKKKGWGGVAISQKATPMLVPLPSVSCNNRNEPLRVDKEEICVWFKLNVNIDLKTTSASIKSSSRVTVL